MLHLRPLDAVASPHDSHSNETSEPLMLPDVQDTQYWDEPKFKHFLDAVESRLYLLPVNERSQARYEMLSHLQCSALAFEELGESHEVAVTSAIARFGKPASVAHRYCFIWLTTMTKEERVATAEANSLILPAAISFVGISVFLFGTMLLSGISEGAGLERSFYSHATAIYLLCWLCQTVTPAAVGIVLGRRYSCRAALNAYLNTVLRSSIPVWFVGKVLSDAGLVFIGDSHNWFSIPASPWNDPGYQFAVLLRWLVIGLISIVSVSHFKKRKTKATLCLQNGI